LLIIIIIIIIIIIVIIIIVIINNNLFLASFLDYKMSIVGFTMNSIDYFPMNSIDYFGNKENRHIVEIVRVVVIKKGIDYCFGTIS
jgi:hypothetical protein